MSQIEYSYKICKSNQVQDSEEYNKMQPQWLHFDDVSF